MSMEQQYILREMHNKPITVLGYNPARRELLVGFEDGLVRSFEADNGKTTGLHKDHTGWVTEFFYWSEVKCMLSCANDGVICIWGIGGGVSDSIVIGIPMYSMAINLRRAQLIIGSHEGIYIFNLDKQRKCGHLIDNTLILQSSEHTDIVKCIVCHETRIYTAGYDHKLIIYETTSTGKMYPFVKIKTAHEAGITKLIIAKDNENNTWLITSSFDKSVRIWTLDGKLIHRLENFITTITGLCYMPKSKVIWVAAGFSYPLMYDPRSGDNISDFITMVDEVDWEDRFTLQLLSSFPESNQIAGSTNRRHVIMWKYNPNCNIASLKSPVSLESVAFTKKEPMLLFCGNSQGSIIKWERMQSKHFMYSKETLKLEETRKSKRSRKKKNVSRQTHQIHYDDEKVKKKLKIKETLQPKTEPDVTLKLNKLLKPMTHTQEKKNKRFSHKHISILKLLFVEKLDILVAACEDNNIYLWGFDQLAVSVLKNMKPDTLNKKMTDFAVLIQDSKLLTSKTPDSDSVSNRVAGFICRNILCEHDNYVTSLAIIPSTNGGPVMMLSAGWDRKICLWNVEEGELQDIYRNSCLNFADEKYCYACDGEITSLCYCESRNEFAYSSTDHMVYIRRYSIHGDKMVLLNTLQGHFQSVNCVVWNPLFNQWVTGSEDGSVRVWDGELLNDCIQTLVGVGNVEALCIDEVNGAILAGGNNCVLVFDSNEFTLVQTNSGHLDQVKSIIHIADRQQYVSASIDGTVRIWNAWRNVNRRFRDTKTMPAKIDVPNLTSAHVSEEFHNLDQMDLTPKAEKH